MMLLAKYQKKTARYPHTSKPGEEPNNPNSINKVISVQPLWKHSISEVKRNQRHRYNRTSMLIDGRNCQQHTRPCLITGAV